MVAPNVQGLAKVLGFKTTTMRRKIAEGGLTLEELHDIADCGYELSLTIGPNTTSVRVSNVEP